MSHFIPLRFLFLLFQTRSYDDSEQNQKIYRLPTDWQSDTRVFRLCAYRKYEREVSIRISSAARIIKGLIRDY